MEALFDYRWLEEEKKWVKIDIWQEIEKQNKEKTEKLIEAFKKEVNTNWARKTRLNFLNREIKWLNLEVKDILRVYKDIRSNKDLVISQSVSTTLLKVRRFKEKEKLLKRYYYARNELNGNHQKGNGVTQEMIEMARSYPFPELLEVNRNKFALCPFHNDHSPSFYTKGNFGHCFSCGWNGDSIKFVMDRDKVSFVEAVKRLCSR